MKRNLLVIAVIFMAAVLSLSLSCCVETSTADNKSAAMEAEYNEDDWSLILVNKDHPVPSGYNIELAQLDNGVYVDGRILPDLQNMFDDMRREGFDPVVGEGYRTNAEQKKMMSDKINEFRGQGYSKKEAEKLAKNWVALPGTSEHELGLALDINSESGECEWDIYAWLADNAHRYGFILRYPEGKEQITGIEYEPWHYRYVGRLAAEEIYGSSVTLEEYLGAE